MFSISVCEQAYTMAQNLDPNSDGRGVLQFKTGLMSVIKVLFKCNLVHTQPKLASNYRYQF